MKKAFQFSPSMLKRMALAKRTKVVKVIITPAMYAMLRWMAGQQKYNFGKRMSGNLNKMALEGVLKRIKEADKLDNLAMEKIEQTLRGNKYEAE